MKKTLAPLAATTKLVPDSYNEQNKNLEQKVDKISKMLNLNHGYRQFGSMGMGLN
jgi:hypothetical protein